MIALRFGRPVFPMFWLLQNNFSRVAAMTSKVAVALRESGRDFWDFSSLSEDPLPHFPIPAGMPAFFYGSTQLIARLSRTPEWRGYIVQEADNLDLRAWVKHRSGEMLNETGETLTLGELEQRIRLGDAPEKFFIRPTLDQKLFAARVIAGAELATLGVGYDKVVRPLSPSKLVTISAPQEISAEYRFFVHQHEIRLASQYRSADALAVSPVVPEYVLRGARVLAQGWMPSDLAVMDLAVLTTGQLKIVEFNNVHSSGLYAIEPLEFIGLVESVLGNRTPQPSN